MKLTPEQIEENVQAYRAWLDGKKMEWRREGVHPEGVWKDYLPCNFAVDSDVRLRIKPTPKLRPWKGEEVPIGALIRNKKPDHPANRYVIIAVNGDAIAFGRAGYTGLEDIYLNFEHSKDNGCTWLPCGVEE